MSLVLTLLVHMSTLCDRIKYDTNNNNIFMNAPMRDDRGRLSHSHDVYWGLSAI
jgi:hypothetical protein